MTTRRDFLAASAAATLTAPRFLRARNANDKLNLAVIGVGGQGGSNLRNVSSQNIVAICDVNAVALDKAATTHAKARKFTDFRKVFDHHKEFDAVVVSTCEHTHAFATLPALQLKKHVYCEKPLTHNIWEARLIREEAKKAKVATQMGTQIHASDNFRRVVELIQAGAIGPVREAHVWVSRAWGRQSPEDAKLHGDIVTISERPKEKVDVPATLDWELWLGPAPHRPFHPVYVPGPKWYRWWDFGSGTMSDLGSHFNDLPFWALKLQAPLTVEASGPPPHAELAPASMQAMYEFPARDDMPAVRMTWYQGTNKPALLSEGKIPSWGSGMLFIGDKGMLLSDYTRHLLLPEKQYEGYVRPKQTIAKSIGHHAEWIKACKTGQPTTCNFEYAGWLTEANHLGNVAYRVGKKLTWDAAKLKAKGCDEADAYIRREYRKGWKLA